MRAITIDDLNAAAHVGGAGSLTMRLELEPASGPDGVIAPAKYVDSKSNATYIYEKRFVEGQEEPVKVVLIDSKTSFANRAEETTTEAVRTGEGLLSRMPRIVVEYALAIMMVSLLPRRGHMSMRVIPLWRTCCHCLNCLRKLSSLVAGIPPEARTS